MLNWLNQNAGGVQAGMAVFIGLLTIALIVITARYTSLTRRMTVTMERQLAASFQPDIDLQLVSCITGATGFEGQLTEHVSGTIVVINKGNVPIKIVAVTMKVAFDKQKFPDAIITQDARQSVVAPGKKAEFRHLSVDVPQGGLSTKYEQIAQIHCSDLAGVGQHTFEFSDQSKSTTQSLGFQEI